MCENRLRSHTSTFRWKKGGESSFTKVLKKFPSRGEGLGVGVRRGLSVLQHKPRFLPGDQ